MIFFMKLFVLKKPFQRYATRPPLPYSFEISKLNPSAAFRMHRLSFLKLDWVSLELTEHVCLFSYDDFPKFQSISLIRSWSGRGRV